MKKLLPLIAIPFLLLGCKTNTSEREVYENQFSLSEKYFDDELKGLVMDDDFSLTQEAIDSDDSFGVFIYQNGCSACAQMKPRVQNVLSKLGVYFYAIPYRAASLAKATCVTNIVKYTPSVVLFNQGEPETFLDAENDEHISAYSTEEGFKNWLTFYINI